ncbi:MAG: radical SAM protein [Theionarchaea archaeon]|nr:radical SAM protein [Theionarchaea archaeon]
MVSYERRGFKTILNKFKYIDGWFWCRYSVNPYSGCEFACTYCDSRSHKYHLHSEFDQIVYAKTDVGFMLDGRLRRARTLLPDVVAIGGSGDAYQPAEERFHNTHKCLEVLLRHHYPVFISTKSDLVRRDADLLGSIARDSWCTVATTITTFDQGVTGLMEPLAPPPEKRLKAIEEIKYKRPGIQAGVNLIPVIPFLTDGEDDLAEVVSRTKGAGADFVLFGSGMTMRDDQARWFLTRLKEIRPELLPGYLDLYGATFDPVGGYQGNFGPSSSYLKRIDNLLIRLCEENQLPYRVKRFIPNDFRRTNYLVSEVLLNQAYRSRIEGRPWKNIHWAGMNIGILKESLENVAEKGELGKIRNVTPELERRVLNLMELFERS